MVKKIKIALSLLLTVFIFLSGCSSSNNETASTGNKDSSEKIVLGFNPWPGYYPWFIAKEKGFFKKYGLNVEIKEFAVLSDELNALSAGQLDAAGVTINDLVVPLSNGIKLKVVGVHDISNGGDAIVVKKNINSFQDLKNKKFAAEIGTVDHLLMMAGMKEAGLKESDINITNMTSNDAGPSLIAGNLDGAALYEPFISQSVKNGSSKVLFSSADVPGLITDVTAVSKKLADNRPEDVKNLLRAWYDALDYWKQNPDESMEIMAKAAEIPVDEYSEVFESIKMFTIDESIQAYEKKDDYSSLDYTGKETAKFLKDLNMIKNDPNLDEALDSQFLKDIKSN
jgi:NitT/TauT family transport system substrate-binding protein